MGAAEKLNPGSYKPVTAVEVRIWGRVVGAVAFDPSIGFYAFEYDPAFVRRGIELAPLQMPLALADRPFVFLDLPEQTYRRLPAMLADALPDKFGNALINAWMAGRGVAVESITILDRLAYMGRRGMGALEFRPARGPLAKASTALQLASLVEMARQALSGKVDTDDHAKAALSQIISVGTSAAGARAKAVVAWNPLSKELRAGQFDVDPGFEHWLLKFDGVGEDTVLGPSKDYGRIEYAYYLMAKDAGLRMSECRLFEENGRAHFMTKRFDREGNERVHMQSLCAMAHLDFNQKAAHSYNQLFDTIVRLDLGRKALLQAYTTMVFNVMAANMDDHTKNFAFLLREGGRWELAPAFDITHAHNPQGERTNQHQMSVNGKFGDIERSDLRAVADRFDLMQDHAEVIERVALALAGWHEYARQAGVSQDEIQAIAKNLQGAPKRS